MSIVFLFKILLILWMQLNHVFTQNKAFSCIFVLSFIAQNKKYHFSFCNKILWVGPIFFGLVVGWETFNILF